MKGKPRINKRLIETDINMSAFHTVEDLINRFSVLSDRAKQLHGADAKVLLEVESYDDYGFHRPVAEVYIQTVESPEEFEKRVALRDEGIKQKRAEAQRYLDETAT